MRWALIGLVVSSGCLGGKAPKYDFYVLTPTTAVAKPASEDAAPEPAQISLAVTRVDIPGYLDREQLAVRADDNRVSYSRQDRWAEPLDQAFERNLRQDLAATLAAEGIAVPPNPSAPTFEVRVEVLRFEQLGPGSVELWARWTLRTDSDELHSGETRLRLAVPGVGTGPVVAVLSDAVARLADEIAGQVKVSAVDARAKLTAKR